MENVGDRVPWVRPPQPDLMCKVQWKNPFDSSSSYRTETTRLVTTITNSSIDRRFCEQHNLHHYQEQGYVVLDIVFGLFKYSVQFRMTNLRNQNMEIGIEHMNKFGVLVNQREVTQKIDRFTGVDLPDVSTFVHSCRQFFWHHVPSRIAFRSQPQLALINYIKMANICTSQAPLPTPNITDLFVNFNGIDQLWFNPQNAIYDLNQFRQALAQLPAFQRDLHRMRMVRLWRRIQPRECIQTLLLWFDDSQFYAILDFAIFEDVIDQINRMMSSFNMT